MLYLLKGAGGTETGAWIELQNRYKRDLATLWASADTWGAVTIEISPDGVNAYPVSIDGDATITANGAFNLDFDAEYIRATTDASVVNGDIGLTSYPAGG